VLIVPAPRPLPSFDATPACYTRPALDAGGKAENGWVFPAKKAKAGHIVDNTVYEPHTDAVKKSGVGERKFVLYSVRHTEATPVLKVGSKLLVGTID
jgi:hypothetical protein